MHRRRYGPLAGVVGVLALGAALVAGCTNDGDGDRRVTEPGPGGRSQLQYVALGDSFTAGPGVPETVDPLCLRSDRNYPALVAEDLGAELVDVSCSGATTEHMIAPQSSGGRIHPPQFDALGPGVDLVTVSVGGNDFNLFALTVRDCARLAEDPAVTGAAPCRELARADGRDDLRTRVRAIGPRLTDVLRAIRARAPRATVLVVGYPQIVPRTGRCPELPLAPGDYAYARATTRALTRVIERAAEQAGAEYVDVWRASAGRDVCAQKPWINGGTDAPGAAQAYHPFAAYHEAVAGLVADAFEEVAPGRSQAR